MSSTRRKARPKITPLIGALLRFPHEEVLRRLLAALADNGFDITASELPVLLFPGPEGRRPSELARQSGMSRQAMNYLLAGLERRGYIERSDHPEAATRVVRLTERGWALVPVMRQCVAEVEKEWTQQLGAPRFEALRETLYELAVLLGKVDADAPAPVRRSA